MTAPKPRTMTHPKSGLTITVDRDHAYTYASQGWVEEKPAPKKAAPKSDED